ncbi:MAG: ATP-binding protein [Agathobacter sp.]|nr:ATP-binding protein [Agathobacter sp.]
MGIKSGVIDMNLDFNIYFETSAVFFMLFNFIYVVLQYDMKERRIRIFCIMNVLVLLANALDVITAVMISNPQMISVDGNKFANTTYFIVDAILSYVFFVYSIDFGSKINKRSKSSIIELGIFLIYIVIILSNYFTGIIFYFDESGHYVHGKFYFLVYIVPYFFFIGAEIMMLRVFKAFTLRQKISIIIYIIVSMLGAFLQLFFFPNVLLSLFTIALTVSIMLFSIETPEFAKLNETMAQLEEARDKAQKANLSKSRFLANMSHEIRTPVNAIVGLNELIIRESEDENVRSYANDVQLASNSLLSIINDILDISRIESGKMEIVEAQYDVGAMVDETCKLMIQRAKAKKLEFSVICENTVPKYLIGDEVRIRQVFINLMTNAIKYTKEGSVIVRVKWQEDAENEEMIKLLLSVEDTGVGIAKENHDSLFSSYERFDEEKNKGIEGTGLGLSISKQLVELMHGEIGVYSELDKGSLFYVELPQRKVNEEVIGTYLDDINSLKDDIREYRALFKAPDARLLVVDDVKANLIVMKGLLKETEVRVDVAESGKECIKLCQKNNYDIIFLDHMMPDMDGIDTLKVLKSEDFGLSSGTVIIALTANAIAGAREEYLELGFDGYLSKPINAVELERAVMDNLPKNIIK